MADPLSGVQFTGPVEESADPWKHRSLKMRCQTCMWFVPKEGFGKQPERYQGKIGRCRRHAPTMSGYPVVYETDWCGDHTISEETA